MSTFLGLGQNGLFRPLQPYVIAEIGVNHEGSLSAARRMIEQAAAAGAHATKFQTYKADLIASKDSPVYWDLAKECARSQYELFKRYDALGSDDYAELESYCRKVGVEFMSTPFDLAAVDMLDPLVKIFKVASGDITNVPLLRRIASKEKPVILSTGAASPSEIEFALRTLQEAGANEIALLHCVLNYPTPEDHAQLGAIRFLQRRFPHCLVGYSDHVPPLPTGEMPSLELAVVLGAAILEKHFTYDKTLQGNDHYHAMDENDLRRFMGKLSSYRRMLGSEEKELRWEEEARRHARRSIVTACAIKKGEMFTEDNLIAKRPGHGISPAHWDDVLGRRATKDIARDNALKWEEIAT